MMPSQQVKFRDLKCAISSFVANYIAGVLHPFDVIKTRFQSHDGKDSHLNIVPKYRGIVHAFAQIYQTEGLKGFFKGFYMSLFSQAVASSFFFWLYQKRKQKMLEEKETIMKAVTYASLEAGIIATVATQPFWVIKTRMLLNTDPNISQRMNFYQKTKQIYGQYGLRGYSKGLSVNIALAVIGATQMYFYEGSKIIYDYLKIPQTEYSQKNFICGGISRILSGLVMYPFTTIRTRLQQNQFVNNNNVQKYSGAIDIITRTAKQQGIRGFYKGLFANILKGIPQKGMYFYFYELIKEKIFNIREFKGE